MNAVLREFPRDKITLLVIWEGILLTDSRPPSDRDLARAADPRAAQFWDKDRWVSRAIKSAIVARGQDKEGRRYRQKGDALWDTVAIYAPGVRWGKDGPMPAYSGGPVENVTLDVREALQKALTGRETKAEVGK